MKRNDYLLLTATAAYSFLFYHQLPGLNLLLFTLLFVGLLLIRQPSLLWQSKWLWAAGLSVLSAACVFIHSSVLSYWAMASSLLLLSAFSFSRQSSALFGLLFSLYSVVSSLVLMSIDAGERLGKRTGTTASTTSWRWLGGVLVVFVAMIFFFIYRASNPVFKQYTDWISLDFISLSWIGFTLAGFLIVYGLFYHHVIPAVQEDEVSWKTSIHAEAIPDIRLKRLDTELFSGKLLFIFLNLMVVVINIGDINTLFLGGGLPKGVSHSDFVHNGVGMLILSIVIALSLIMYFFRQELHYMAGNRWLKYLVVLWVLQNGMMLLSTVLRNNLYVDYAGLTYKRIGVYVWLFLAFVGLCLTAYALLRSRSNWFLIRTNVALWLSVLPASALVDWDLAIIRYNVVHVSSGRIDVNYLYSLSNSALPDLIAYQHRINKEKPAMSDLIYDEYIRQQKNLHSKIYFYLLDTKNDWRSYNLRQARILKALHFKPH